VASSPSRSAAISKRRDHSSGLYQATPSMVAFSGCFLGKLLLLVFVRFISYTLPQPQCL
jgi:hypothetical protein